MFTIKVENLTKEFNGVRAVNSISFNVNDVELFGILGPNGAGKTTTINMLTTLLKPTSGYVEVAGYDISNNKDEVRRHIGVVFQEPSLDINLTGKENLEFHAMMYKMDKDEREKRIKEVLELVELTEKADVIVENYSGGMKRRLELARGFIHKPKVLFLDEPTLGLDTQTRRHIWDYIKKLNREGNVTIILTTHYMDEADYLCDRVAIIDNGKIVAMDTSDKLKDVLGGDIVSLEIKNDIDSLMNHLKDLKWIESMKKHNNNLNLTMERGEKRIPELISIAQRIGVDIDSVNLHKPSLEDVFLYFTGKTIREQDGNQRERNREIMRRRVKK